MQPFDLHIHTIFSDGANTPEDMIGAGIKLGLEKIGISDHSYTDFDTTYGIKKDRIQEYKNRILSLKQKNAGKIEVLLGIEQDYYSNAPTDGFDYLIGSVHYLFANGEYLPVDESAADTKNAINNHFGGDPYAFAAEYFRTLSNFAERDEIKIIGHFDILTKFNEQDKTIDTNNPRYVAAWQSAADALIKSGKTFEINYRSMYRGLTTETHPSNEIISYLIDRGATLIKSSDSHSTADLIKAHKEYF